MTQPATHPLVAGHPPAWACGWGQDRHGVFAEFRVGDVRLRMRWIPAGSFWMGSPKSEDGRWDDEGPQHFVTLTSGFWLADTPCTQELWHEVRGSNPSHFERRPHNPVESVSWKDCQAFFERLNDRLPGAEAGFPTEAQWEYACRAGTEGASWLGDLQLTEDGVRDIAVLDSMAWYDGNRGDHEGTREVGLKPPNPWGLFDMLGNVHDWVEDAFERYAEEPQTDPLIKGAEGVERVIRGGSWNSDARNVRAASRNWYHPDYRLDDLGFRLSLGQSSGAERGGGSRRPGPGAASERGTSGRSRPGRDSGGEA